MSSRLAAMLRNQADATTNKELAALLREAADELEHLTDRCDMLEDDLASAEESLDEARRDDE